MVSVNGPAGRPRPGGSTMDLGRDTFEGASVRIWLVCALVAAALLAACSGNGAQGPGLSGDPSPDPTASQEPSGTQASQTDAQATAIERGTVLLDDPVPDRLTYGWETNFDLHSVPYAEIVSGGPPRDGIPPIDSPVFFVASRCSRCTCGSK